MIRPTCYKHVPLALLIVATGVVIITMFYFALRLNGDPPVNCVQWSDPGPGLSFKPYSMVHGRGQFPPESYQPNSGLTLELAIEPRFTGESHFKSIMQIYSGKDDDQLMVGQWRSHLIVMNGKDYSHQRRKPRISLSMDESSGKPCFLTVVSSHSGTAIYVDGQLTKQDKTLLLKYPQGSERTRMVFGNSIYGNQPWTGIVKGLALYDRALDETLVKTHHGRWLDKPDFNAFKTDNPSLLYALDEGKGTTLHNGLSSEFDLALPNLVSVLKKDVLSWPRMENFANPILIKDAIVNLIGFMPLGFFLAAIFSCRGGISLGMRWALILLFVFSFSMLIEIVQIWLPLRYSSSMDLMLNTFGGGLGVLIFNISGRYLR